MEIVISTFLTVVLFALFKMFAPHHERKDIDEKRMQQMSKKFVRYELLTIFPLFISIGIVTFLIYYFGNFIVSFFPFKTTYDFYVSTKSDLWLFPGVVLGLGFIMIFLDSLYVYLLGEKDYTLLQEFSNRRYGFDGRKVITPFCNFMMILGIVLFILSLRPCVIVDDGKMTIQHFFSLSPKTISLNEIKKAVQYENVTAPNGNIKPLEHIIFFDAQQNEILNTRDMVLDLDERFVEFVLRENELVLENEILR